MGLFGGGNSSSSTTNNTFNTDRRIALDNASQGITGDGNSIFVSTNATDHGAIAQAVGVSNAAVAGANQSLMSALYLADGAVRDTLSANASVTRDALAATTSATRDAISSVSGANRDSLSFASAVNRDSIDLAARGQTLIANSAADSLGMVGHVVDLAFRANDKNSTTALDAVQNASGMVARAYDTATGYQAEKQTADSKYLVVAGLIAVALVAVKAFS